MEVEAWGGYQLLMGESVRLSFHDSFPVDFYCICFWWVVFFLILFGWFVYSDIMNNLHQMDV